MLDNLRITGKVHAILYDENNNIKQEVFNDNMVVATGLTYIAERMFKTPLPDTMTHMAIGSSNTAAALSDTALGGSLYRKAFTSATAIGASPYKSVVYTCAFTSAQPVTTPVNIYEMGIFNAELNGTMLCRTVFATPIVKNTSDTLTVVWTINIG